ncbi:MAG: glycoside hydrolase [Planctomycetaceae bacterium]|jgi:hypothetical protein|nr:glycoside hydrolase [Planctomycetaceae bacterium]
MNRLFVSLILSFQFFQFVAAQEFFWSPDKAFPIIEDLAFPNGIEHSIVENGLTDRYKFLHDPAIVCHKGTLYVAWYNCPEHEIVGESLIRGRRSSDLGQTWSDIETIASDTAQDKTFYVPVQFLSHEGTLYAFVGIMVGGHDLIKSCGVYSLDEKTNRWIFHREIAERFLPLTEPVKMTDGNFIMGGRITSKFGLKPFIPAVLISNGNKIVADWKVVPIHATSYLADCPETALIVEDCHITAFSRNEKSLYPFIHYSNDYGQHWDAIINTTFLASPSKLYAGKTSTDQRFLLFNVAKTKTGHAERRVLGIAVSKPGEKVFSKIYKVRDDSDGIIKSSFYPCAIEFDKKMYIVYTAIIAGRRHCCLSKIPIESLMVTSNNL